MARGGVMLHGHRAGVLQMSAVRWLAGDGRGGIGGAGYALSAVVMAMGGAVSRAAGSATLSEVAKGSISSGA